MKRSSAQTWRGVLEFWSSGALEFWSSGVLELRSGQWNHSEVRVQVAGAQEENGYLCENVRSRR